MLGSMEKMADPAVVAEVKKGYHRQSLHRDAALEIATARWVRGGESVLHGHGVGSATYCVLSGTVEEERYIPDGDRYRYERVVLEAGARNYLPPGTFHKVKALTEAVTMHYYSPAPEHSTEEVPVTTLRLLAEAKSRAEASPTPSRQVVRPNVVEVAEALAVAWGEREEQANRDGALSMPAHTLAEMRQSGILAAPLSVEYGGWGASLAEVAQAVRLVARHAPSSALALVMPLGNAATCRIPDHAVPTRHHAALAAGKAWIADRVRRGKILAVANSEPGTGGDLANTKTLALPGPDGGYRLTGRKSFATFGRDADYFLCAARRAEPSGKDVIDGFFVARNAAGLAIDDKWDPLGMRPTASVGLLLDGAVADAVLGYPGCLEGVNARHWSTVLFGAVFLGVGEGALREGVKQASPGGVWSKGALAEKALALDAGAGYLEAVAAREEWPMSREGRDRTQRCKTFLARTAVEVATVAAMVSGGRCYTASHPVMGFLADALAGPLLRPPLPQAMDAIVSQVFAPTV
ncbi:MAG: acyl-CoA dehydrogenase family protein [Gemmataceae bacterium]